jgi:protein-tyrosine-phosphatase
MPDSPYKILFLCTGNSARSIMAEFMIREIALGRFDSYSAGANPRGEVNPFAINILKRLYRIDVSGARSKSLTEFRDVQFDFVVTLCDKAKENCPVWPGQPIIAHWGLPDPAAVEGTELEKSNAFLEVARQVRRRLELFCSLPMDTMERIRLEHAVQEIGKRSSL